MTGLDAVAPRGSSATGAAVERLAGIVHADGSPARVAVTIAGAQGQAEAI